MKYCFLLSKSIVVLILLLISLESSSQNPTFVFNREVKLDFAFDSYNKYLLFSDLQNLWVYTYSSDDYLIHRNRIDKMYKIELKTMNLVDSFSVSYKDLLESIEEEKCQISGFYVDHDNLTVGLGKKIVKLKITRRSTIKKIISIDESHEYFDFFSLVGSTEVTSYVYNFKNNKPNAAVTINDFTSKQLRTFVFDSIKGIVFSHLSYFPFDSKGNLTLISDISRYRIFVINNKQKNLTDTILGSDSLVGSIENISFENKSDLEKIVKVSKHSKLIRALKIVNDSVFIVIRTIPISESNYRYNVDLFILNNGEWKYVKVKQPILSYQDFYKSDIPVNNETYPIPILNNSQSVIIGKQLFLLQAFDNYVEFKGKSSNDFLNYIKTRDFKNSSIKIYDVNY